MTVLLICIYKNLKPDGAAVLVAMLTINVCFQVAASLCNPDFYNVYEDP